MAIYHFSGQIISRSAGRSVVAAAAYRAADHLVDERYDVIRDYTHKADVAHAEILLSAGAPDWMADREKLWNAVEAAEKRKDAQLAREFQIALPRELTLAQNIALAREFVQQEFVARGMVADLALHNDIGKDGKPQPHIHVLLSLREITSEGFGQKVREWNDRAYLLHWREAWAEIANRHLTFHDYDIRIDHRTLAEQGIDLTPQSKIGAVSAQNRLARLAEHQRIARENGERLLANPLIALEALTQQHSTFTHPDLARLVSRQSVEVEQFNHIMIAVKSHPECVSVGKDEQGLERWTTQTLLTLEKNLIAQAMELSAASGHRVAAKHLAQAEANSTLSAEQAAAFGHLTSRGDLKCVVGFAGTGKSYLLGAAREAWEAQGYRVMGATLAGKAAEGLEAGSGIESRTLASHFYRWDNGQDRLTKKDILVVDEAGMLGSQQMARLVEAVQTVGAKLALIGDPEQLQAIQAGAAFRAILERVGYVELTEIWRQREAWQREATKDLATHETGKALAAYQRHGLVHEAPSPLEAQEALIQDWNAARLGEPDKTYLILAYTRAEVQALNAQARSCRQTRGELGEERKLITARGERAFAEQDRVYFLKNDRELGVMNGSLGTIEQLAGETLTVRLDAVERGGESRPAKRVKFSLSGYNEIDHGYAATLHKSQGVTVDRSFVLASTYMDSQSTYVALSRHRDETTLYYSREAFSDRGALTRTLSRDRGKDISVDYEAQRSPAGWTMTPAATPSPEPPQRSDPAFSDWNLPPAAEMDKVIDAFLRESNFVPERQTGVGRRPEELSPPSSATALDVFKHPFEAEHPELTRSLNEQHSPRQERLALEAIQAFGTLEKALTDSLTPRSAQAQIERYADGISRQSGVMCYLREHTPELSEKIDRWAETHQLSKQKERDLGEMEL